MPVPRAVVLGVPTSAGAHHAGQDLAPAALRAHGFTERLAATGIEVEDGGDLAGEVFMVDHGSPGQRSLAAVVRVARAVADGVERVVRAGPVAVVLGGDCTITLG
jgi:arginase